MTAGDKYRYDYGKPEPLLSLEEPAVSLRIELARVAAWTMTALMVGNRAPIVQKLYDRLHTPRIDDWVYEWSTGGVENPNRGMLIMSIGILRRVEDIPTHRSVEAWRKTIPDINRTLKAHGSNILPPDAPIPTSRVYYVQYGPESIDVCRCKNSAFYVIPVGLQL